MNSNQNIAGMAILISDKTGSNLLKRVNDI